MMTYLMLWSHILPLRLLLRYDMFAERSPCALGTTHHCLQVEASLNTFNLTLQLSGVPNCVALPVVLRGSTWSKLYPRPIQNCLTRRSRVFLDSDIAGTCAAAAESTSVLTRPPSVMWPPCTPFRRFSLALSWPCWVSTSCAWMVFSTVRRYYSCHDTCVALTTTTECLVTFNFDNLNLKGVTKLVIMDNTTVT